MGEVKKFEPRVVGEGFRFNNDDILDGVKGEDFQTLVVIGEYEDGEIWVSGTANKGESLIVLERAKSLLIFGSSSD